MKTRIYPVDRSRGRQSALPKRKFAPPDVGGYEGDGVSFAGGSSAGASATGSFTGASAAGSAGAGVSAVGSATGSGSTAGSGSFAGISASVKTGTSPAGSTAMVVVSPSAAGFSWADFFSGSRLGEASGAARVRDTADCQSALHA